MTIQKLIAVIAAVTSITLFGNLVMLPGFFTEPAAQTSTSLTAAKTAQPEKEDTTQSSEIKEAEAITPASDESKAAEETMSSSEVAQANEQVTNEAQNLQTEEVSAAEQPIAVETPIVEETPPAVEEAVEAPVAEAPAPVSQWQPNMLQIAGSYIPYSNAGQGSGQAVIDANHGAAATWGGAPVQSGNDGMNTHIIGHNPGAFNVLFSLGIGSVIEVSDASGQVTSYTVQNIITVDDSAYGLDGADYWDQITGAGGGERITLQTCINDFQNLIVFAA